MRNLLLLILIFQLPVLIAQARQDTVFAEDGKIENIKFFNEVPLQEMTRAERFQRGLTAGRKYWKLDSIQVFNATGTYRNTRMASDLDPIIRKPGLPSGPRNALPPGEGVSNARKYNERFTAVDPIRVTNYANGQAAAELEIWLNGEEPFSLRAVDLPANIRIPDLDGKALRPGHQKIKLEIDLIPGVRQQAIRLAGPDKEQYDIRLVIRGYDLTEKDFVTGKDFPQLDVRERAYVYLRLESTEKLLTIYQEDRALYNIPVGRQIDQLPVYQLPPGAYRMEIIDLGTGRRRSYGLRR